MTTDIRALALGTRMHMHPPSIIKGSLILGASIIYFINDLYKKRIHACTRDIHIERSKQFK